MSGSESALQVVAYWLDKADQALDSAESEIAAGRTAFAVNRCYYACFYAASAVLLRKGSRFSKHAGVRAAVHRDLVRPGLLPQATAEAYDRLFDRRQEADYLELVEFCKPDAVRYLDEAKEVVARLRALALADT